MPSIARVAHGSWGNLVWIVAGVLLPASACGKLMAQSKPQERVFVTNEDSGTVTVIDAKTRHVTGTIQVGKRPRGVRAIPDEARLLVAVTGPTKADRPGAEPVGASDRSADGIAVVDLTRNALLEVLPSGAGPEAFDLAAGKLFVSNEENSQTSIVDLRSGRLTGSVAVGAEPEGVTSRPDGKVVYVTSEADSQVFAIDTQSQRIVGRMRTGTRPRSIAFSPDGRKAYVTNELGASISVLDAQAHLVQRELSLAASEAEPTPRPMGIVVSPDGDHVYVTTGRGRSVVDIDARLEKVARVIRDVGARPWGIGITADGATLFVANGPSNDVAVIDAARGKVEQRIQVGSSPWGVALAPAGTHAP